MGILGSVIDIVEGFPTVDLQTGANTGDYVSLKNAQGVLVLFRSGVGTAGDDPTVVFQQAQDVSGTSVKDFNPTGAKAWKKQAATSLASTGTWSSASGDLSGNDLTNATAAEQSVMWAVEIDADELDVDNGFDCIRATVADVGGNAQPGDLLYILYGLRYQSAPSSVVSAIAD